MCWCSSVCKYVDPYHCMWLHLQSSWLCRYTGSCQVYLCTKHFCHSCAFRLHIHQFLTTPNILLLVHHIMQLDKCRVHSTHYNLLKLMLHCYHMPQTFWVSLMKDYSSEYEYTVDHNFLFRKVFFFVCFKMNCFSWHSLHSLATSVTSAYFTHFCDVARGPSSAHGSNKAWILPSLQTIVLIIHEYYLNTI